MRKFIDIINEATHCPCYEEGDSENICNNCGMHAEWHRGLDAETMERSARYARDVENRSKMFDARRGEIAESEIDEGLKSAVLGAAAGAAALAGLSHAADTSDDYDDMSFRAAFAQAMQEKGEGAVFKWRGKTYKLDTETPPTPRTTDYAGKKGSDQSLSRSLDSGFDKEANSTFLRR